MDRKLNKAREKEKESVNSDFDNALISWRAPEFITYEKGPAWKLIALLLVLGVASYSLYTGAWSFALVIVVFSVVYYISHMKHPKILNVKISNTGIKIGAKKIPYGRIKGFWIVHNPPFTSTLTLHLEGEFLNRLTVLIADESISIVREILIKRVMEVEGKHEPVSDMLLRLFKL